jgi:uncharacterized membrane protein YccF (DUF307 family)
LIGFEFDEFLQVFETVFDEDIRVGGFGFLVLSVIRVEPIGFFPETKTFLEILLLSLITFKQEANSPSKIQIRRLIQNKPSSKLLNRIIIIIQQYLNDPLKVQKLPTALLNNLKCLL